MYDKIKNEWHFSEISSINLEEPRLFITAYHIIIAFRKIFYKNNKGIFRTGKCLQVAES